MCFAEVKEKAFLFGQMLVVAILILTGLTMMAIMIVAIFILAMGIFPDFRGVISITEFFQAMGLGVVGIVLFIMGNFMAHR